MSTRPLDTIRKLLGLTKQVKDQRKLERLRELMTVEPRRKAARKCASKC